MSLLDRMKNFLSRNSKGDVNNIQPLMDYREAKGVLDNLGGLEYCRAQKEQGVSQKELAQKLHIKQPVLSSYCMKEGCKWTNLNKAPKAKAKAIKPNKRNRIKVLEELGGYDYVLQQRELGKTYSQISVELGQEPDDNWISNYMRYRGYKTKPAKFSGEANTINEAGGLIFLRGELRTKSVRQIAKELGIRQKAVYSYLYKRGYTIKRIRQDETVVEVPDGAANWALYEDWDNDYTVDQFKKAIAFKGIPQTAQALNCTENTLRVYCTLRGIPL